ncbi:polysaccharide biosynthesis protein [Acidobacteriota bacterium]
MKIGKKMEAYKSLVKNLFTPTKTKRFFFFFFSDIFIIVFSFYSAFFLRFGFTFPDRYFSRFWYWLAALLILKIISLYAAGLYNINWRFVSLTELLNLIQMGTIITAVIFISNILVIRQYLPDFDLPRGIIIIEAFLSFFLIGILRIAKRVYFQLANGGGRMGKRSLIIGADYTSERLMKELLSSGKEHSYVIAIVDEDPMKIGTKIAGIPVLGGYKNLPEIILEKRIESVLINLPRASHKQIAVLFDIISPLGIRDIKVVPRIDDYDTSIFKSKSIRQLDIGDLLSREPVKINPEKIESYIKNKVVLVTGAAGSIGSEILRQLISFGAVRIIGYEIDETEIFNLERELKVLKRKGQELEFILGDVRDREKLDLVFERHRPQVVFHAAACKHVPVVEKFPDEAIKTNVSGTLNLVETAVKYNCEKLINISTDKAVNPASVMGASKRMAEMICTSYNNSKSRKPHIVSVRFGNVLGSRGSVVPIFLDQIKKGRSIEITHKDMKRYFMSLPEAVVLVLQAASMGKGGEVFVLDMGDPVRIVHLAETLILLNNLIPYKDIDIVFTGLRPGEKLFEELLTAEEGTMVTAHDKIFIARNDSNLSVKQIILVVKKLEKALYKPDNIKNILKEVIPSYQNGTRGS